MEVAPPPGWAESGSFCVTGKPGGGKSLLLADYLLYALAHDPRPIVTNLPVVYSNVVKVLLKRGFDVDVASRLLVLDHEQVPHFYLYRGPETKIDSIPQSPETGLFDFSAFSVAGGCIYLLDEVHEFLNARAWKTTGPETLAYIAKHRHLGDLVFWATQSPRNVDRQFRSVTQAYLYCRNYGKEKFRGFRKPSKLQVESFLDENPGGTLTPQETFVRTLPKDTASVYNTSVLGGKADTGSRLRGLPTWTIYAGVIVLCALVATAFMTLPNYLAKRFAEKHTKPTATLSDPTAPKKPDPKAKTQDDSPTLVILDNAAPALGGVVDPATGRQHVYTHTPHQVVTLSQAMPILLETITFSVYQSRDGHAQVRDFSTDQIYFLGSAHGPWVTTDLIRHKITQRNRVTGQYRILTPAPPSRSKPFSPTDPATTAQVIPNPA